MNREQEAEANYFAICLLMPEALLRADVRTMGGVDLTDDTQVSVLAKRYGVSISMMAVRLKELAND